MHAIQKRCRPKHQVLVLKCYPRTTKGAVDVKPNSSELSYLLYYATSRRTKIQKVGNFLERKTASDVWRQRIGNVQVTLQIVEALIEKNPKDLPLFAPNVVKILDLILRSNDLTMIESSVPTFEAFCAHHDASTLLADQVYLAQFEAVVGQFASLASTRAAPTKVPPSKPVAMRWRSAGLESIRAVAASDALSSIAVRKYDTMVPMILENLCTSDNRAALDVLLHRADLEEQVDSDRVLKRRNSVATVRTADTAGDTNPIALSGTAMDVDRLAEEDIGVLAMLCLKQVFINPSRSHIHYATMALLGFVRDRIRQGDVVVGVSPNTGKESGWAAHICTILLRWVPVQERYIILITLTDALARTPLTDDALDQHIALATMIAALLRSDASLIGLSVMDVLLGFLQHIRNLVQMPGDPAAVVAAAASSGPRPGQPDPRSPTTLAALESASSAASKRRELLTRLQQCIGDLATHVYYADQIADMVSTVLFRLKPPRIGTESTSTPTGEKTDNGAANGGEPGTSPKKAEQPPPPQPPQQLSTDSLFSLPVAKTAALRAVKAIFLVANPTKAKAANSSQTLSRNRVPIQVWEGTHWLLRDLDGQVRKAYVDAVLTWLDRETSPADERAREENTIAAPASAVTGFGGLGSGGAGAGAGRPATRSGSGAHAPSKRVVSGASRRTEDGRPETRADAGPGGGVVAYGVGSKQPAARRRGVFFLSFLHLAIYDNALQFVDYETDIVLLHVLLHKLVDALGVNAVRYGLPMIFQLQEAIQEVDTPQAKVRLGSLVHGYFWTLVDKFRFDASGVGRAIHNEITRRRTKHFWVEGVNVPPPLLELVGTPGMLRPQPRMPLHEIESEALLPFDDREALIDHVCAGYREMVQAAASPPQSPKPSSASAAAAAAAPGGSFSASFGSYGPGEDDEVPAAFRELMAADWSREGVLQAIQQAAGSKSASLSGSRSGTLATNANTINVRNRLAVNTSSSLANNGYLYFNGSGLSPSASQQNLRANAQRAAAAATATATATTTAKHRGGDNNDHDNAPDNTLAAPLAMRLRKPSTRRGISPSPVGSLSSRGGGGGGGGGGRSGGDDRYVTSVDQLKLALSGAAVHAADFGPGLSGVQQQHQHPNQQHDGRPNGDDASTDSMTSYDMSVSDLSFNPIHHGGVEALNVEALGGHAAARPSIAAASRKSSTTGEMLEPLKSNPIQLELHPGVDASAPPVPPLPSPLLRENQAQQAQQVNATATAANATLPTVKIASPPPPQLLHQRPGSQATSKASGFPGSRRSLRSRGGGGDGSMVSGTLGDVLADNGQGGATLDLQSLLIGIDSRAGEASLGNLTRPPY